jgi:hypothetical protein
MTDDRIKADLLDRLMKEVFYITDDGAICWPFIEDTPLHKEKPKLAKALLAIYGNADQQQRDAPQTTAPRWRHKKRGTTYTVVGECQVQAEEPLTDYEIAVVYRSEADGSLWVRRRSEFHDGRFETLALSRE